MGRLKNIHIDKSKETFEFDLDLSYALQLSKDETKKLNKNFEAFKEGNKHLFEYQWPNSFVRFAMTLKMKNPKLFDEMHDILSVEYVDDIFSKIKSFKDELTKIGKKTEMNWVMQDCVYTFIGGIAWDLANSCGNIQYRDSKYKDGICGFMKEILQGYPYMKDASVYYRGLRYDKLREICNQVNSWQFLQD